MKGQHFPQLNIHSLLKQKSQKIYNQTSHKFAIKKDLQLSKIKHVCLVNENKLLYSFIFQYKYNQRQVFEIIDSAGNICDWSSFQGYCNELFMPTNDVVFLQIKNIAQKKVKLIKWDLKHRLAMCVFQIQTTDQYDMIYFAQTRLICLHSVSEKSNLTLIFFKYLIEIGSCIHIFQSKSQFLQKSMQPREIISIRKINERQTIAVFFQNQFPQQFKFYVFNLHQSMMLEAQQININLKQIIPSSVYQQFSLSQICQIEPLIFYIKFSRSQHTPQDDRVCFSYIWNQNTKSYRKPNFHVGDTYYNIQFTTQFHEIYLKPIQMYNPTYFIDIYSEKIVDKFVPKKKDRYDKQNIIYFRPIYPAYNTRLMLQINVSRNLIEVQAIQLKFGYQYKLLVAFILESLFPKWDYTLIQQVCQLYRPEF